MKIRLNLGWLNEQACIKQKSGDIIGYTRYKLIL